MSHSSQNWLSFNLKANLLVGISGLATVGTGSGVIFGDGSAGIRDSMSTVTDPIVNPIIEGAKGISSKVQDLQAQGYNKGLDFKEWVDSNFNKSKIKTGWLEIYKNIKSWGTTAGTISKEVYDKIGSFLKEWDTSRQTLHTIFNALGGSFSIVGSLFGTWDASGESKLLLFWEVLQKEEFPKFLTSVSTLASKHPRLLSQLEGNDIPDILNAFKQDSEHVITTMENLSKEEQVDRMKLMNSLKLLSVKGRADALMKRAQTLLRTQNKEEIQKIMGEIQKTIRELGSIIKANEDGEAQQ
ncbi:hypothetical protein HF1_05560 [Mycoplasma haemofelis str. Langford 1]|uniref:Uncharacterized protein n=1 Tax=Mycoplasma haemofelis (strain Langford 1) TaxID=941640 RepID=E8ZHE3_MYCHL|nr:hypothetical protein [Mycoplasma haemofelis]CBY92564.1 hypothetical protein HF1_05560 [Mycoplasma haemofelis str. Langford 1]